MEVGKPFQLPEGEWVCIAKLMGREYNLPWLGAEPPPERSIADVTHTIFLAQGRGPTEDEALRNAMEQIDFARRPSNPPVVTVETPPPVPEVEVVLPPHEPGAVKRKSITARAQPSPVPPRPAQPATPRAGGLSSIIVTLRKIPGIGRLFGSGEGKPK